MSEEGKRNLCNAMVLAFAGGDLTTEEKAHAEALRKRLGIDERLFAQLCEDSRGGARPAVVSRDLDVGEDMLRMLVDAATTGGEVSPTERRLLHRLTDHIAAKPGALDALIAEAAGYAEFDGMEMEGAIDEIYHHFAEWDDATRCEKLAALVDRSRLRIKAIVRIFESYRSPEGMADALGLKVLVVEQFRRLGDSRPVYYLAQQVDIGDADDQVTSFELRAAAAEAIGDIIGRSFSRDQAGIDAAREWWRSTGHLNFNYLVY